MYNFCLLVHFPTKNMLKSRPNFVLLFWRQ